MADPEVIVKPRDVMPEDARTLPARFYVDPACLAREIDLLFRRRWICAGRADEIASAGPVRAARCRRRQHHRHSRRHRQDSRLPQRLPSSRHAALHGAVGPVRGQHPVSVSRLDLRSRWPPGRRAAHGRSPAFPQGRLPAPCRPRRRVGRPPVPQPVGRRPRLSSISSAICRRSSGRGRWTAFASATASSTTSRRTGS